MQNSRLVRVSSSVYQELVKEKEELYKKTGINYSLTDLITRRNRGFEELRRKLNKIKGYKGSWEFRF